MHDLPHLERCYEELLRYLDNPVTIEGRLLSVAIFVGQIPTDLRGRDYYLEGLAPHFRAALGSINGDWRDREMASLVSAARDQFVAAGALDGDAPEPAVDDSRERLSTASHGVSQFTVTVPLVQEFPPRLASEHIFSAVGTAAQITIAPRMDGSDHRRCRWNNGNVERRIGNLRSLEDVAGDALLAAGEALRKHRAGFGREFGGGNPSSFLAFDLSLPEKEIPIAGDSAGLALAAGMLGALAGAAGSDGALRPADGVAWTGRVEPSGTVAPVDAATLPAKARAAHFAGAHTIVVPAGQSGPLREALAAAHIDIRVVEIGHLSELFDHGELLEDWPFPPDLARAIRMRPVWLRIRLTIRVFALLAFVYTLPWLVAIFGIDWYTWWRPAPAYMEARVERIEKNTTLQVDVPHLRAPIYIRGSSVISWFQIVDNLGCGVGDCPYLVYGCGPGIDTDIPGNVTVYDLKAKKQLWAYVVRESGLAANPWPDTLSGTYAVKAGVVDDFDGDGRSEIVVTGAYQQWSHAFIWNFGDEKRPIGVLYHSGHLERIAATDLDHDEKKDLLTLGFHSGSRGLSLIASHPSDFAPFRGADRPSTEAGAASGPIDRQPCLWDLVIPVLPGLELVEGRSTLGIAGELLFTHSSEGSPRILIEANVSKPEKGKEDKPTVCDYMILTDFSGHPTRIIPNAPMVERARFWLAKGKTDIDFVSDDVMNEWLGMMRNFDTVRLSWPPEEGQAD